MPNPPDDDERPTDVKGMPPLVIKEESTAPSAVAYRLVCVAGPDLGRSFTIASPSLTIGRGNVEVALRATDVSRHHARIYRRGTEYAVEDLGSANKTFVNGHELRSAVALRSGDRLQVGANVFVFSHRDELEDRMHQLQRMESLATLAAGLAHDFNNALAVILGGLALVERRLQPADDLSTLIKDMRGAASSASNLAQRLLRLGRANEPAELEPVDLASLLSHTVGVIRRQLSPDIRISVEVPPGLVVRSSQEELHQVVLNLILNARDAMPSGGTLTFGARALQYDLAQATSRHLPQAGNYIELVARDTGTGMDSETLARVFEPFFTTKPPGQGTGLGLAMLHTIVRRHGGSVIADSALGHGTTFTIWLPAA